MNIINHSKLEVERNEYEDEQVAFVANVFYHAASGSFNDGYLVEFSLDDEDVARELVEILAVNEILPKLTPRNNRYLVQLTTAECVCNLLAFVGARYALLDLNNEIAMRELRNNTNRRVNFEGANLSRQVEVGIAQATAISTLDLSKLNDKLRVTAEARLDNPEASYEELASILGITKSGVVNRFRQIFR